MEAKSSFVHHFHFQIVNVLLLAVVIGVASPSPSSPSTITFCPLNHYAVFNDHGNVIESCEVCRRCPPGYGAHESCSATENTVCRTCPTGTFSNSISLSESCQRCRTCGEEGIQQECTPISDTICNKRCPSGEYYDPLADECRRCSYCFPDRPNARTVRIRECRSQGLDNEFQCSPLPPQDAVDDWAPPLVIAMPDRNSPQNEELDRHNLPRNGESDRNLPNSEGRNDDADERGDHRSRTEDETDLLMARHINADTDERMGGRHHGEKKKHTQKGLKDARILAGIRIHDEKLSDPMLLSQEEFSTQITDSSDSSSTRSINDSPDSLKAQSPQYPQQDEQWEAPEKSQSYRSFTSADIGLVVGIAIGCGLLSFLVTALTCHCCLVRRGKSTGPRVSSVSGKPPVNAWTYVDLMPTTDRPEPAMETPTMSRRVTIV